MGEAKETDSDLDAYFGAFKNNLGGYPDAVPACVFKADKLFVHLIINLHRSGHYSSSRMLLFAHSALRQALAVITTGGVAHAAPIQRQALDAGAYGYLFRFDKKLAKDWENRDENKAAAKRIRNLGLKTFREILKRRDPALLDQFNSVYENLLSGGAHPNVYPITMGSSLEPIEGTDLFKAEFAYLDDDLSRQLPFAALCTTTDVIMRLFEYIYPERFQLIGMAEKLSKMREELLAHLATTNEAIEKT